MRDTPGKLISITTRINDHMPSKMWDKIIYPYPNFNCCTVEDLEWIGNFIPHFTGYVILPHARIKVKPRDQKWRQQRTRLQYIVTVSIKFKLYHCASLIHFLLSKAKTFYQWSGWDIILLPTAECNMVSVMRLYIKAGPVTGLFAQSYDTIWCHCGLILGKWVLTREMTLRRQPISYYRLCH